MASEGNVIRTDRDKFDHSKQALGNVQATSSSSFLSSVRLTRLILLPFVLHSCRD